MFRDENKGRDQGEFILKLIFERDLELSSSFTRKNMGWLILPNPKQKFFIQNSSF